MMPLVTGIDLFCGVGGLTCGLRQAGIDIVAGVDIDAECEFAYTKNNHTRFLCQDVEQISGQDLAPLFGDAPFKLLAGCAPCQPFSTYSQAGRSDRHEADWPLLRSFGRLVRETRPDLVTMENVPRIVSHDIFDEFLADLADYQVRWSVVECTSFGVPQSRRRLVLTASRFGADQLELVSSDRPARTVRQTIGGLAPIPAGGQAPSDPLHMSPRLSALNLERIRASRPGGTWRDWPEALLASCHRRESGSTYPSVYGRMSWDEPAPTITTQCFGYGNGRFGHPEQDRAISLREAALLQTFPESYELAPPGSPLRFNKLGRLIGNAVPVLLGEAIGRSLLAHVHAVQVAGLRGVPLAP